MALVSIGCRGGIVIRMVVFQPQNSVRYLILIFLVLSGCAPEGSFVVAYVSQDQVYAEPILKEFTEETGIQVRAVYDSEAIKTVGLVNRLLAEQANPQCDLLWNNEDVRPEMLAAKGVIDSMEQFGFRSRQIVYNTRLASPADAPPSLIDFTNSKYRGKIVMAYPLFGTTASHMAALRTEMGSESWESWCRALMANEVLLVDGNSVVVQFVGRGDALYGITDFDDIQAGQRERLPVDAMPLALNCYFTRNTAALISGSKRRKEAEVLARYLTSPEVIDKLVAAGALEGVEAPECGRPASAVIYKSLEATAKAVEKIFVKRN